MPKMKSSKKPKVKYFSYANGFIPPTKEKQVKAIGCDGIVPPEYSTNSNDDGYDFFKPIPLPTSIDDWLAQYNAKGQTYHQYVLRCPWLFPNQVDEITHRFVATGSNICEKYPDGKIYLLPIGSFSSKHCMNFNELATFAGIYLGIPVCTLPAVDLEVHVKEKKAYWIDSRLHRTYQSEIEGRFYGKHQRYQLGISSLLSILRMNIPSDALCLIGLTMSDLYKEDSDLFVAGWAAGKSRVAVFSFFRYDPSLTFSPADWYIYHRNGKIKPEYIQSVIFRRSCKLLVHEIGHLLGIGHCIFFECCMNGSGHLKEDFRQPIHLCPVDLHKLQTLVGFDISARYKKLQTFYEEHSMKDESDWVSKRLAFIGKTPVEIDCDV